MATIINTSGEFKNIQTFPYHKYNMDEKDGSTCFSSGTNPTKINGTYFYDDVAVPVDTLHDTTTYPEILKNALNKYGGNKAAYLRENGTTEKGDAYVDYSGTVLTDVTSISFYITPTSENGNYNGVLGFSPDSSDDNRAFVGIKNGYLQLSNVIDGTRVNGSLVVNYLTLNKLHFVELLKDGSNTLVYINSVLTETYTQDIFVNVNAAELIYFGAAIVAGAAYSQRFIGYLANLTIGTFNDPLNGSAQGTATNVDFNKINIPNDQANAGKDVIGRDSLNTGSAKYNAEVVGGVVADFDGTPMQRITFNYKADGNPTVEACVHITKANGVNNWIIENSNGANAGRLLQLTRNSSNLISFVIYNSAGTAQVLTSVNTYLQGSKICVNAWYDGSDLRLQIRDLSGNLLEDLTNNIGAITLRNTLNDRLDVGGNSWLADPSLQGSIWSVKYTSGSTLVLDTSLNNHAINSVDNIAGTIFLGVTFTTVKDYTPQSTIDSLAKTVYKDLSGNLIIDPQYPLTTETELKGKGYKGVGFIDFDPLVMETYESYGGNLANGITFPDGNQTEMSIVDNTLSTIGAITTNQNPANFNFSWEAGKEYRIITLFTGTVVGTNLVLLYDGSGAAANGTLLAGTYTDEKTEFRYTPDTNDVVSYFRTGTEGVLTIQSVQEVTEHIDSPNRGEDLITNGDFTTDTDWTKETGWTIDGVASYDGTGIQGSNDLTQAVIGSSANETYIVNIYINFGQAKFSINGGVQDYNVNTIGFHSFTVLKTATSTALYLRPTVGIPTEIAYLRMYPLEATTSVGHLPHAIMNTLAFDGNSLNLTAMRTAAEAINANYENAFLENPENITCDRMAVKYENGYEGYVYMYYKNNTLVRMIMYANQKYNSQQETLLDSKWCPEYDTLPVALTGIYDEVILVNGLPIDATLYDYQKDIDDNAIFDIDGNYIIFLK